MYISIIVPAYNAEKTIEETLESLLAQNFPADKYEIILVDNGSKDRTINIVKKYPIRIVTCNKRGSSNARNKGASYARGRILAFTDADCRVDKNWLNEINEAFKDEGLHAAQGQGNLTHSRDTRIKTECFIDEYLTAIASMNERRMLGDTKNFAIRKWVFEKIGGFIPSKEECDMLFVAELFKKNYNVKFNERMIVYHNYSLTLQRIIQKSLRHGLSDYLSIKSNKKGRLEGLLAILSGYRLVTHIISLQHNNILNRLHMYFYFWFICILRIFSYLAGSYFTTTPLSSVTGRKQCSLN